MIATGGIDFLETESTAIGIDTGCAYGGALTALVMEGLWIEVASVPATGKWAEWRDEKWAEE